MSNIWICAMRRVCPANRSAGREDGRLHGTNFNNHAIDTVHFGRFIPLSLTLTLGRVTRSSQSKTSLFHFLAHVLSDQDDLGSAAEAIQVEYPE